MKNDIGFRNRRTQRETGSHSRSIRQVGTIVSLFAAGVITLTGCTSEVSPQTPRAKTRRVVVPPAVKRKNQHATQDAHLVETSQDWLPKLREIADLRREKSLHHVCITGKAPAFQLSAHTNPAYHQWGAGVYYRLAIHNGTRMESFSVTFNRYEPKRGRFTEEGLSIRGTGHAWRTEMVIDNIKYRIRFAVTHDPDSFRSRRSFFKSVFASAESFRDYQIAQLERLSAKIDKDIDAGKGISAFCKRRFQRSKG